MRQLTEAESKLANKAFANCAVEGSGLGRADRPLFHAGFIAGLDHAQAKIDILIEMLKAAGVHESIIYTVLHEVTK